MSAPGQNGPGSEADSAANSPAMRGAASASAAGDHEHGQPSHLALGAHEDKESREQDRLLPIANISRLMKKVLPDHAKMSKEAKAALQESVSEFIGFITSEASDRLVEEKRKTITGDDIIDSMRALGFDSYMEFLQQYLKKYRQSIKASKGGADKPAAAGAHKRGRKARGADDDEEEHSESPVPLGMGGLDYSALQSHNAAMASAAAAAAAAAPSGAAMRAGMGGGSVSSGNHSGSHSYSSSPMTAQSLLAQQLLQANHAAGAGNTEDDKGVKRRRQ